MKPTVNTGMSLSDWSALVTAVVAICALLSPTLTAFFNNQHQLKIKKLEYEHQEREAQQKREHEVYEAYIQAAGAVVYDQSASQMIEFGKCSKLAMYYVPPNIRPKMAEFEKRASQAFALDGCLQLRLELLDEIVIMMREARERQSSAHQ